MSRVFARFTAGLLAACLSAQAAFAFDGTYGNCLGQGEDGPIVIRGDEIFFPEMRCRMTNPVLVRDMPGAVLFDFRCEKAGAMAPEAWTERALVQWTEEGGIILVRNRTAQVLPRCP